MKIIFLTLFLLFFNNIYAENKTCYAYVEQKITGESQKYDIVNSVKKIEESCKSGYILDFRIYKEGDPIKRTRYDSVVHFQSKFCNYKRTITQTFNDEFYGFTCVFE